MQKVKLQILVQTWMDEPVNLANGLKELGVVTQRIYGPEGEQRWRKRQATITRKEGETRAQVGAAKRRSDGEILLLRGE